VNRTKRNYVVSVPVVLRLQVLADDPGKAHWSGVEVYEWMQEAINDRLAFLDRGEQPPISDYPDGFGGYRVLANFDKADTFRASLDLDDDSDPDEEDQAQPHFTEPVLPI
jgi:hypothetical protein